MQNFHNFPIFFEFFFLIYSEFLILFLDADVGKKLENLIASKKSLGHSSDGYTSGVDIQQMYVKKDLQYQSDYHTLNEQK